MIAASQPVQRAADARLLIVNAQGRIRDAARTALLDFLLPGDLVVANDAATLPASLSGTHEATGGRVEVRLAGRPTLDPGDVRAFRAIVFGEGDYHTRTEDRPAPPALAAGDRLKLGPLTATVRELADHPRLVLLAFEGSADAVWSGIAHHGRPIQYAHVDGPLRLWDVWSPIAGPPVAFEPPSATFALDWRMLGEMRRRRVEFATLTHAAGISSTGDDTLDRRLPFDEPYAIPERTAAAIRCARARGGRVVAVGTTVVRALEHAAKGGRVRAGAGLANNRIGPGTPLRMVDAILSGTHEPGTSHYELLRGFTSDATLHRASAELDARSYRTHDFGDSVLIERMPPILNVRTAGPCPAHTSKS